MGAAPGISPSPATRAIRDPLAALLGNLTVPIARREDLIRMKRASDRPQDEADVALLEALKEE